MRIQEELDDLRQIVSNDKIGDLTTAQLERYTNALCFSHAGDYFSDKQYPQVCEAIRLLLHKRYFSDLLVNLASQADESAKVSIKLTDETRKLTKRLLYLTWAITIFTIIMVFQNFIEFSKYRIFRAQNADQPLQYVEQYNNFKQGKPAIPTVKK